MPTKEKAEETLKVRRHHLPSLIGYLERPEVFEMEDADYLKAVKEQLEKDGHPPGFYSDKTLLHLRTTLKKSHDNPDLKIEVVEGIDAICEGCDHKEKCDDSAHEYHGLAKEADTKHKSDHPLELKPYKRSELQKAYSANK